MSDIEIGEPQATESRTDRPTDTLTFDWGRVDVYFGPKSRPWPIHRVVSDGAAQFDEPFSDTQQSRRPAPFDVTLDVHADVPATHPNYPFNERKNGWRDAVGKDVEQIRSRIRGLIQDATFKEAHAQEPNLKLLQRVNPLNPAPVSTTSPAAVKLGPVQGGDNAQGPSPSNVYDISARKPLLHSNLNIDLASEMDAKLRARGQPPDAMQLFSELGSVVADFTETAAKVPGYEQLSGYRAGLSFDKEYAGTNVPNPFSALLVNPFYREVFEPMQDFKSTAGAFVHVMMHEAAHHMIRGHEDSFNRRLAQFDGHLHGSGAKRRLLQATETVLERHWDTYLLGREIHGASSTRNAGKSLVGARFAGGDLGTDARHAEGGNHAFEDGGRRSGVAAGMAGAVDDTRDVESIEDHSISVRYSAVQEYNRIMSEQASTARQAAHEKTRETDYEL